MRKLLLYSLPLCFIILSCGGNKTETPASESNPKSAETKTEEAPPIVSKDGIGSYAGQTIAAFDEGQVKKGEEAFAAKCKACHNTDASKLVGPGLKEVTNKRTAAWILNMITNPVEMTEKDPDAKALLEEYKVQMAKLEIPNDEALAILNYLRKNDAAN